jgi:hypothetical protein
MGCCRNGTLTADDIREMQEHIAQYLTLTTLFDIVFGGQVHKITSECTREILCDGYLNFERVKETIICGVFLVCALYITISLKARTKN